MTTLPTNTEAFNDARKEINDLLKQVGRSASHETRVLTTIIFHVFTSGAFGDGEKVLRWSEQSGEFNGDKASIEKKAIIIRLLREFSDFFVCLDNRLVELNELARDKSTKPRAADKFSVEGIGQTHTHKQIKAMHAQALTRGKRILSGVAGLFAVEKAGGTVNQIRLDGRIECAVAKNESGTRKETEIFDTSDCVKHAPKPNVQGRGRNAKTQITNIGAAIDAVTALLMNTDDVSKLPQETRNKLQDLMAHMIAHNVVASDPELTEDATRQAA